MKTDSSTTVYASRNMNASPEQVFDAWLDPESAGKWLFATPAGQMVHVEIDARVGGRFAFVDRREGEDIEHTGEYLAIERPNHLAFTFSVPKYSPIITRVSIDISPSNTGCNLALTHKNVLPEYTSRTEEGWTNILAGLERTLVET
jgi:uncharacterized protein YndB with AHSA1/START domain